MMQPRIIFFILILALLASIGGSCTAKPAQLEQPVYWPAQDWRTSTPEEQGLDSSYILAMLREIQGTDLGVHSLLIVRHGYLVTEVYFPPYQQNTRHPAYSMTKSITSAMVGKAIQDGYIKSIQQKAVEFFPDIAQDASDPRRKEITIEHLLTMSAGYNTNTMPDLYGKDASFDTVQHILTYNSVLVPPGASFFYDSGLPHLLSAIIQEGAGTTLQAYTEQELFQPLGITDYTWDSDPRGITTGATGLMLRPRDMAKFGYLYLHSGEWNGTQVLPKEWVETSTRVHIETKGLMNAAEDDGYGYLWWIDSFGGYSAHGFGGQYIFVLPPLDMVVVFTGGLPGSLFPVPNQLFRSYLLPAAQSSEPLEPNEEAYQSLANRIQTIEQGVPSNAPLPEIAQAISGKTFRILQEPHMGWFDTVALTFTEAGTYQNESLWPGEQSFVVIGSLDEQAFHLNQVTFPFPTPQDVLFALRGHWQDDTTFIEEYVANLNTDIDLATVKYTFTGDKVTLEVSSKMELFSGQAIAEMDK
jgi:CubicO group peptidase (beta-lactamase class C family)